MEIKTIEKGKQYISTIKTLQEFEETINRYYSKNDEKEPTKEFGHLIDKKILDNLKKNLGYDEIKNNHSNEIITNKMNQIYEKNIQTINYKTCEEISFDNCKQLEEDLKTNKSEYIIVNQKIFELITKNTPNKNGEKANSRNNNSIKYEINSKNMILFLKNNEKAYFKHDSNIINYSNLLKIENINANSNNNDKKDKKNESGNMNIQIYRKKNILFKLKKDSNEGKNITSNKKGIMTILNTYIFYQEINKQLKQQIRINKSSSNFCTECYLIKDDWFSKYKNYFLYEEIYKYLNDKEKQYHDNAKDFKINDLMKIFDSKLNQKNNQKEFPLLINEEQLKIEFKLNYEKTEMLFENKYIIINEDILKNLFEDNFDTKSIKKLNLCINESKIIIKYDLENIIFIGSLSEDMNNIFIPEIVLKYDEPGKMNDQFEFFEKNKFSIFENDIDIINKQKADYLVDKNDPNKKICELFLIDKIKYNNINKYIENILINIYNNDEESKLMKQEEYYIINNKYIKKLKYLIKYDEFLKLLEKKDKNEFNNIINENISKFDIDKNFIKTQLENNEILNLKKEKIKDSDEFYYTDFELISNSLKECLMDYDMLPKDLEIIKTKSIIKNEAIIICPVLSNKYFAFICNKNENDEYQIEILYQFNDEKSLGDHFNKLDNFKLNFENKKIDILDEKGKKLGVAYEIIEKDKNEIIEENKKENIEKDENEITDEEKNEIIKEDENINAEEEKDKDKNANHPNKDENKALEEIKMKDDIINMIKIYLYNKDLLKKIASSKTEIITNEKNEKKENIFNEKCFLIDKEEMNLYKNYCLYNELEKYINDNIIKIKLKFNY